MGKKYYHLKKWNKQVLKYAIYCHKKTSSNKEFICIPIHPFKFYILDKNVHLGHKELTPTLEMRNGCVIKQGTMGSKRDYLHLLGVGLQLNLSNNN